MDVAFLALPAGHSAELAVRLAAGDTTVIDIGADLRLRDPDAYPRWYGFEHPAADALADAVSGLPELVRDRLPDARLIANPGCHPTAALLALAPLAGAGLLDRDVIVDARSGISGAGRGAGQDYLFTELDGTTQPYGLGGHRHTPEIAQGLSDAGASGVEVTFVPHLVPQARGLIAMCNARLASDASASDLASLFTDAYAQAPFVHVLDDPPGTKLASGTNHAFVHVAQPRRLAPDRDPHRLRGTAYILQP